MENTFFFFLFWIIFLIIVDNAIIFQFNTLHTCDFITNQLAGLDLADAPEQAPELLLGHVLGQVVHYEVRLAVVVRRAGLHGRGAAAAVIGRAVGRGTSPAGAICHRSLHVADDLGKGQQGKRRRKEFKFSWISYLFIKFLKPKSLFLFDRWSVKIKLLSNTI